MRYLNIFIVGWGQDGDVWMYECIVLYHFFGERWGQRFCQGLLVSTISWPHCPLFTKVLYYLFCGYCNNWHIAGGNQNWSRIKTKIIHHQHFRKQSCENSWAVFSHCVRGNKHVYLCLLLLLLEIDHNSYSKHRVLLYFFTNRQLFFCNWARDNFAFLPLT